METKYIILLFIVAVGMSGIGWFANDIYRQDSLNKQYNGLRFVLNNSHQEAIQLAQTYDKYGDWVCVNVKGMDFNKAVETCQHESAHEIFAEIIEKNPDKIKDVMGVIGK